jgi:precorrin-6B methylase 2
MRRGDINAMREIFIYKEYSLDEEFLPKNGQVVMDIGAGIGDYALLSSLKVGNKGLVISIEADDKTFRLLLNNIRNNSLNNVIPIKKFVSFHKYDSIDYFVRNLKVKKIDIIKIDIEGGEYNALIGGRKTLKKYSPKLIMEIHSEDLMRKILKLLNRLDYKMVISKRKGLGIYICYFKKSKKK